MMKYSNRLYSLVLVGFILGGCASPAEMKNMVVNHQAEVNAVNDTPFKKTISIKQVNGGESTNPLWTSEVDNAAFRGALTESLKNSGLLASNLAEAKYDLHATLAEVDQPLFGLSFTVSSRINYRVTERMSLTTWFEKPITAAHTATFSEAPFAIQRLRFANEGSIRENIKQFITLLMTVQKPPE